jgi:hypothetical protein
VKVGIDDQSGLIYIYQKSISGEEWTINLNREDIPEIIQFLQDALKHQGD